MKTFIILSFIINGLHINIPHILTLSETQIYIKGLKSIKIERRNIILQYDVGNLLIQAGSVQIVIIGLNCRKIYKYLSN